MSQKENILCVCVWVSVASSCTHQLCTYARKFLHHIVHTCMENRRVLCMYAASPLPIFGWRHTFNSAANSPSLSTFKFIPGTQKWIQSFSSSCVLHLYGSRRCIVAMCVASHIAVCMWATNYNCVNLKIHTITGDKHLIIVVYVCLVYTSSCCIDWKKGLQCCVRCTRCPELLHGC